MIAYKNFRTYLIIMTLALVLLLAACGGGQEKAGNGKSENSGRSDEDGEKANGNSDNGEEQETAVGVPVRVREIARGDISTIIPSTSVIEAEQSVDIYSRVTATVIEIKTEEGDVVGRNTILCNLEDEELTLSEAKAVAEMEKLERDLERTKGLVEQKILTGTDLIEAQYRYEQAVITWKQRKTSLDYTKVRSTINGIVYERLVRLGQKVDPSTKLYSVFNPKSLVINIHIPENDYFHSVAGREKSISAVVSSESLPGKDFYGSIKRISPTVNSETNTIKITIAYKDPGGTLRPGMYVRVNLITDVHKNAVLIPKEAILYDENRQFIFIVRDNKAKRIVLESGYSDASSVEAKTGVEAGDLVVVVGQNGLKDGTVVRLVDQESRQDSENDSAAS